MDNHGGFTIADINNAMARTHIGARPLNTAHTQPMAHTQSMAQQQTQTQQRQAREAREDFNHAKDMGRQLADHHWGTGSLWLHPSNQLGLLNYDIGSISAAAKTYVHNTHADFPRPGMGRRGMWDNFVEAYLDQSYVVLSHKMGTQENMEETVDAVGSLVYGDSIRAVTVEELPEYFIAGVRMEQSNKWEQRCRELQDQWALAVGFGDHHDPQVMRYFINMDAEQAWTDPNRV